MGYPKDPGFEAGSDTSRWAAESMADGPADIQREYIDSLFDSGRDFTCDEIEVATGWLHQSVSARIRELYLARRITKNGKIRPTRRGRPAVVYWRRRRIIPRS
jgi:hypothetical protein